MDTRDLKTYLKEEADLCDAQARTPVQPISGTTLAAIVASSSTFRRVFAHVNWMERNGIRLVALLAALFLTSCLPPAITVVTPNPPLPPTVVQIAVDVRVACGTGDVAGATVTLTATDPVRPPVTAMTTAAGFARFTIPPAQRAVLSSGPVGDCGAGSLGDQTIGLVSHVVGGAPDAFRIVLAPPVVRRTGLVRRSRHAYADDGGEFNPLGASLFWLAWGYEHDRPRLDAALDALQKAHVDYVRSFAAVGFNGPNCTLTSPGRLACGDSWGDRTVDPTSLTWASSIAGATEYVYQRIGARVSWVIFAGLERAPQPADRDRIVRQFAAAIAGHETHVFQAVVMNEENGLDPTERRALGNLLHALVPNVVSLGSLANDSARYCAAYVGFTGQALDYHYERDVTTPDGVWKAWRGPWGTPDDAACPGQLDLLVESGEPLGPQSSVAEDGDPRHNAAGYAISFFAGNGAHVFHTAPGIRGGGSTDLLLGHAAAFADLPRWPEIQTALTAVRDLLPPGLANWTRANTQWASSPFADFECAIDRTGCGFDTTGTLVRAYWATSGGQLWGILFGLKADVTGTARQGGSFDVIDPATGQVLDTVAFTAGGRVTVRGFQDVLIVRGTLR